MTRRGLTRGKSAVKESRNKRKRDLFNLKSECGKSSEVSPRRFRAFFHSEKHEKGKTQTEMKAYPAVYNWQARR